LILALFFFGTYAAVLSNLGKNVALDFDENNPTDASAIPNISQSNCPRQFLIKNGLYPRPLDGKR